MQEKQETMPIARPWDDVVYDIMPQFERIARATNRVKWEEEFNFAKQSLQKNEMLASSAPHTVQNSIINVAAVGLTLNPADGYAYLVPEYNKKTRQTECNLRISFKGLIKVATDTGVIKWVKAEVVKENDEFVYKGPCTMPEHSMSPFSDRGPTTGVYCIAKTSMDEILVDVMAWSEVLKIKACAKIQNVWDSWPEEMAKKAIIKRAAKQWPKSSGSSALHKTVDIINTIEGSDFDPFAEIQKSASAILIAIEQADAFSVGQIWEECDRKEQELLWKAKTKGGFFSQDEKTYIRSAITAYHKANNELTDQSGQPEETTAT